jgi:hypothetical protein
LPKYLKSQKVGAERRREALVVARPDGEVVWIPGLQIGERFRVTQGTRRVARYSWKEM